MLGARVRPVTRCFLVDGEVGGADSVRANPRQSLCPVEGHTERARHRISELRLCALTTMVEVREDG
jgi:hypothetical protein